MKQDILFHCGNSPKMQSAIDISLAFAKRDIAAVRELVRDDFTWQVIGTDSLHTLDTLPEALEQLTKIDEIVIANALSHGNGAMAEGAFREASRDSYHFCHVIQFSSTAKDSPIKGMRSYFIPVP